MTEWDTNGTVVGLSVAGLVFIISVICFVALARDWWVEHRERRRHR